MEAKENNSFLVCLNGQWVICFDDISVEKWTTVNKVIKMNIFFFFMLSIVGLSCTRNEKKSQVGKSKFYADIHLFTLSGINELSQNNLTFPYIEMDKSKEDTILLSYHATNDVTYSKNYVKQGETWASINFVEEGVDTTYFYEFIMKNKILVLRYKGNPEGSSYELMALSVMDNSYKEVSQSFTEGLKVKPTTDVNQLLANKVVGHGYTDYSLVNGKLTVSIKIFYDIDKKAILEEKTCYDIGKHSFFWWDIFGPLTTKIECD